MDFDAVHASARELLTRELPELLRLCAASLAAAPIPEAAAGWRGLSLGAALKLAPVLGCVRILLV